MTFLPIVERELRVAARKKGTYLTRVGVGMGAMVLGAVAGLVAEFNPSVHFGTVYFQILSGLAMLYCLGAGRFLTADCLSAEKREETMGLLFLTDLKGYDVVLGKMAATSLNGLYGLLAVLPVLAITLVTGGITYGELCRMALVLLDTFLFSLAVGIFASALTREFRWAMALNFYVLLGLTGLLPALAGLQWLFFPTSAPAEGLFLPCPIYTLVLAFDAPYKLNAAQFWSSAGVILAMSWLLLALACKIAPQSWQTRPAARVKKDPRREQASRSRARAFRNQLLDQNAYYWRAARPWWKARLVWVMIGLALLWLATIVSTVGWLDESICFVVAFTLNGALKFWITLEAGQTLAEDAKSGAFELLLSTPLAGREIVRGQMLALRRQFLKPLVVVAGMEMYFMWSLMAGPAHLRSFSAGFFFYLWMAVILMLAADAVTLSIVAMAAGLTEKNQTMALLKTVRRVLVLPWVLWAAVTILLQTWAYLFPDAGNLVYYIQAIDLASWFGIGMVLDLFFGWKAWRRLTGNFQELARRRFGPPPPRATMRARCAGMGRAIRDRVWRHPRNRKWALRFATVLAVGAAVEFWESNRSHDPPPEVVLIGPGDGTPLQAVAAGEGVFLILPDGSLWRWGQTDGTNRAVLPEQVGTNRDWRMISVNDKQRLGMRRNGTLWEWQGDGAPTQVGADQDWVEAVDSTMYKVARKKDGTLWAWGNVGVLRSLPSSPPVWIPPRPVQLGTNRDWVAVERTGNGMVAVWADGTLWGWGNFYYRGETAAPAHYLQPVQLCEETNWVGFDRSFGFLLARNNVGELWWLRNIGSSLPDATASVGAFGSLLPQVPASTLTSQTINLFRPGASHYEVHTNGTLWVSPIVAGGPRGTPLIREAEQAGQRSDWVAVANAYGATFGLTADGTLWTWGRNLGEQPRVETRSRIEVAKLRAAAALGLRPPNMWTPYSAEPTYPVQEKLRALMKLVPEKGN
jgi:hypothetical protein